MKPNNVLEAVDAALGNPNFMTPKQQFTRIRDAALGALGISQLQTELQPPSPPHVNANHHLAAMLFEFAGEHNSPDAKKLSGSLDVSWLAAHVETQGCGMDDARKSHNTARDDYRSGKSKVIPHARLEYIRQNSERRAMLKQRAQIISIEAQHLAAACWQRALEHLPKFRAKLVEQEKAIFAASPELGTSPLIRMIDALPKLMNCQITKLKTALGNRRPGELIPKI